MGDNIKESKILFGKAAGQYPASETAQAAYLALHTQDNDKLFDSLRTLHHNDSIVRELRLQAEKAHIGSENLEAPSEMNEKEFKDAMDLITKRSSEFRGLTPVQLREILAMYSGRIDEIDYAAEVAIKYFGASGQEFE